MYFLICVLKSEDANGQLEELRAWRSNKRALEGMLSVGEKSPYGGNDFALGRERMPSCLHTSCPFPVTPKPSLRSYAHAQNNHFFFTAWKKAVEDIHNDLGSIKAIREETAKWLKERRDVLDKFYEERKMATAK